MKFFVGICLLVLWMPGNCGLFAQGNDNGFTKKDFYLVMAGKNREAVDKQLDILKSGSVTDKNAYEGALLMKKAGLAGSAKKKLELFKQGHRKLESILQT